MALFIFRRCQKEREEERESRVGSVKARAHARARIGRTRKGTFKEVDIFAVGAESVVQPSRAETNFMCGERERESGEGGTCTQS